MRRRYAVLLLLAVSLFFGAATAFPLFYRLAYLLGLALVASYLWSWLGVRWLQATVERRASVVQVGDEIEERITLSNTGPLGKPWLAVSDLSDLPGHASGRVASLPAKAFRSWRVRTRCTQRGIYTWGPLLVRSQDPFGVFSHQVLLSQPHQLKVYPAMVDLSAFALAYVEAAGGGPLRLRAREETPNAASVREWTQGESLRRIHWPSTARLGKIMVKEFDEGLALDVLIVLDMEQEVQAGQGAESTEEYAVTLAASLVRAFLGQGLRVGVLAQGAGRHLLPTEGGSGHLQSALELLALVRAEGTTPLEQVLAEAEKMAQRHSNLLVITSSLKEAWGVELARIGARGTRTAVLLLDPASFGGVDHSSSLLGKLLGQGTPTYLIRRGEALAAALSRRANGDGVRTLHHHGSRT